MKRWFDELLGFVLAKMGDLALLNYRTFALLYARPLTATLRERISHRRAMAAFQRARRLVPAYRAFLAESLRAEPRTIRDVPVIDKENYVKRWRLEDICIGGRLPTRGTVIDESSGSSGKASNWARGPEERKALRRLIQYSVQNIFGDADFVLINAFALGPWATGMNVSMALVDRCILKSVGPDAAKVIGTLKDLGPAYKYVITGYPPFLKAMVESSDLDWSQYNVIAIVGGEGMSEALRAVLNRYFKRTISSFGASDLEINIAVETECSTALRQLLARDETVRSMLLGSNDSAPMVFQYDPLNYYIESDGDGNLLFTLNRFENISPRIRYNLHDRGVVRSFREVEETLAKAHVSLSQGTRALRLPFLFHYGRRESAVAFFGCKITPEDVQNALLRVPGLKESTLEFALHPFEDPQANKRLEFWFECKSGLKLPADPDPLREAFLEQLALVNQDFRESIRMVPQALRPSIKFFEMGKSPFSGQDIRIKRKYIF